MSILRPVVAFDFDDVLMSFQEGFIAFHNRMYGTSIAYEDIVSYDVTAYACSMDTFTERVHVFYQSSDHAEVPPTQGSTEAVQALRNRYMLDVVTSRPASVRDCTNAWSSRFFPNTFRALHFTNGFGAAHGVSKRSKSEVCKEIGASVLIEDALRYAEDVAQKGIPVLLPDKPWNQGPLPAGVTRIHSWDEALDWIEMHV